MTQLVDQVGTVWIIAHKESTDCLELTLSQAGFECEVIRQTHRPEQQGFSPSYLTLLNHGEAWTRAAQQNTLSLVVEADFVPVVDMGRLPLPFATAGVSQVGIAWLYTCAPQVYSLSANGFAEGFSTSTVAYLITPYGARCLLEFLTQQIDTLDPTAYAFWDSTLDRFLRQHSLKNYLPYRNYGEHGGQPNPEHSQYGLSRSHRADVLWWELAFMPAYAICAKRPALAYWGTRLKARLKGIARLMVGKYVRLKILRNSRSPLRLVWFAISRQGTMRLKCPKLSDY